MILVTDLRKCLLYLSLKDARFPLATAFAPPTCVQHALDVPRVVVLVTEVPAHEGPPTWLVPDGPIPLPNGLRTPVDISSRCPSQKQGWELSAQK